MERFQSRRCRKVCPGLARSGDESLEVTLERHEQCVSARAEVLAERFRRCTFCKGDVNMGGPRFAAMRRDDVLLCSEPRHARSSCLRSAWSREV